MTQPEKQKKKPTELSDFQGLTQIGHGAFGKVYRALHKQAKKAFALKKISKKEVKAQNMITQLNNEIKISRQLDHPNIIRLYDTFDDGEDIYLVLQLAQNGQLFAKICRDCKLDEKTAKQMIRQVVEAVAYLHSKDPPIIHRDIKPENILLDKNNKVKLADFGWSNFLNKPRKTYCGTFDYLAPEMIDKSGHDEKLDIWCIGVLTYELLTGRTPFVVQGPKNQTKKLIQQNILDVNINFPNDFPIMAKNFILGMVKRKPQQRMTLKEIMNHQWLTINTYEKPLDLQVMPKKGSKDIPLIDAQESNIIASLNKRIKELEEEINRLRVNERANADQNKNLADNPEYASLMKELRKLRGVEEKNVKLQQDNQKYWDQISKKDKELIQLNAQFKTLNENQESIDKLKQDKKNLQEKIKKMQKDNQHLQIKNSQLASQLTGLSDSLGGRLARGDKISLNEAQSQQYLELIQGEMKTLQSKFQESKKILLNVLAKQKMTKDKEDQLVRLRIQKARLKQEIKTELKEDFQQQKDQIILQARNELYLEKERSKKDKQQLKKLYEEQTNESPSKGLNGRQDIQLQVKTLRQLTSMHEGTINELKSRIRQLEDENKRRK